MSTFTKFLNLFKWQPDIDGDEEFDIEKSLNENWDKVDTKLETYMTDLTNDVENYKNDTDNSIQNYKDDTDTQIDTFTTNITNKVNELEGEISSQKEISISPTAPTANESVWIKKGKNLFDKNKQPIVSNNVSVSVLDTGIKVTNTAQSQNLSAKYIVCDLTGFEGKQITVSSDILSSGNNEALLYLSQSDILGNEDDSTEVYTGNVTSGKLEVTITITDTLTNSNKYLLLRLYGTRTTQAVIGSYITYSNLVVSQGPTVEYEEYADKEIYVKNDNGVFERFYKDNGIIDSGSNDNFKYIKFSDGTLIQYATIIFNNPSWNQWGSLYYAEYDMSQYKFPVSFIDRPVVTGNISHGTGSGDGWISRIGGASTTDIESLAIARPTTYADSIYVNITAIGRWK